MRAIAAALEAFELRNNAYPFDWVVTPYEPLCQVLEQDFKDFFDSSSLSVHSDNRAIINTYGLIFTHDFPIIYYPRDLGEENPASKDIIQPDWINLLPTVQKKYNRRIQRLRDICMSDKKVYFIRYRGIESPEQACIVRNIIKNNYPHLDFTLVVVGNNPSFKEQWGETAIKNYYLEDGTAWNDVAKWSEIFIDLGFLSEVNYKNRKYTYVQKYFFLNAMIQHNNAYCSH